MSRCPDLDSSHLEFNKLINLTLINFDNLITIELIILRCLEEKITVFFFMVFIVVLGYKNVNSKVLWYFFDCLLIV